MTIEREIRIERHAYERYCERVEPIGWQELEMQTLKQIRDGYQQQDGYLYIGEVWWRGEVTDTGVTLHTCYGKTHINIPEAVRWAKRFKDRLRLNDHANIT